MLAFVANMSTTAAHSIGGDKAEFADADAGGGDGLQDQGKAVLAGVFCGLDEALVFCAGEFFVFVAEVGALDFQGLDEEVSALVVFEVAINSRQECINGGGRIALDELLFPGDKQWLVEGAIGCAA